MKSYKKCIFFALLVGIFLLTGCGIEVSTDMTLAEGFKGNRIISCYVSNTDITGYFKGDIAKIDDIIEKNCPDCLTYEKKGLEQGYEFIFTLSFSSLEEYKTKVSTLLTFSPEISFQYTDSLFSNSIDLTENFSSTDLLCWFEILLKEEYNLKDSQISSLWETKDAVVHWKEESYKSAKQQISISKSQQLDFQGIEIYTEETDAQSFQRRIVFKIPKETLDTELLNLQKAFEKITPEESESTWVGTKTGKNYEIYLTSSDFSSLSDLTNEILGGSTGNGSSTFQFSDYQVFQFSIQRKETLDFSHFLSTKDHQVSVSYYYKPNSFTETNVEEIQKKVNNSFTGKANKKGFYLLYEGNCDSLCVSYLGTATVPVKSYHILTKLQDHGQFERTFTFQYEATYTQEELEYLSSFFQKNQGNKLDCTLEKGTLTILQTGKAEDLEESSQLLFGVSDNTVTYEKDPSIFSSKASTFLVENFDLSRFLGDGNKSVTGTYCFLQDSKETLRKFSMDSDYCQVSIKNSNDGTSYEAEIEGSRFFVSYEGSIFYLPGLLLLIGAVLLLVILVILFVKKNPMKDGNTKKTDSTEDEQIIFK